MPQRIARCLFLPAFTFRSGTRLEDASQGRLLRHMFCSRDCCRKTELFPVAGDLQAWSGPLVAHSQPIVLHNSTSLQQHFGFFDEHRIQSPLPSATGVNKTTPRTRFINESLNPYGLQQFPFASFILSSASSVFFQLLGPHCWQALACRFTTQVWLAKTSAKRSQMGSGAGTDAACGAPGGVVGGSTCLLVRVRRWKAVKEEKERKNTGQGGC